LASKKWQDVWAKRKNVDNWTLNTDFLEIKSSKVLFKILILAILFI
jgi:hypothetical protein